MALPTGPVTFLFTDIEGSTELLSAMGAAYAQVLDRHNRVLRGAFARHRGIDVMSQGDSLFAVFESPADAVAAAIEAQELLAAETWPSDANVNVRIGIHTGIGTLGGDNYVGLDVHRAARVESAANGGQILATDQTRALAAPQLGDTVTWLDLGRHRLKGLPEAERIFQVSAGRLRTDFPPVHTLEAHPHNLPRSLTTFVGRDDEIATIRDLLRDTRLLTLTGPGGTGKTRLGVRVAEEVVPEYGDGCYFVALDALRDPTLVPVSIADAFKLNLSADTPAVDALSAYLADRNTLLVLDNFEQVAPAGADIARLLHAAARLHVLATSRVPLHVYGEREYPVPPLADGAVELFVERAAAVRPGFALTAENAGDVAAICRRLDGLPLAIELAAARVKLLTPRQILARLTGALDLATTTADSPERQRTLRGAIDWSYQLLPAASQRLLAALAVFRGGFTLEAAEEILSAGGFELDVLDGLALLVDNSLLRVDTSAADARYSMLETIREYARDRLDGSPDARPLAVAHARHFFALAIAAGPQLVGRDQEIWLERLDREEDNLRAAFTEAPQVGLLNEALIAAGTVWRYWQRRGHFAEGRAIFDRLLAIDGATEPARQQALSGAGGIAYWQADRPGMAVFYEEALALAERLGDRRVLAEALKNASFVPVQSGDLKASQLLLERSASISRELGDEPAALDADASLGWMYLLQGEPTPALETFTRLLDYHRATGAKWPLADNLTGVALVHARLGDWKGMAQSLRESIETFAELHYETGLAQDYDLAAIIAGWIGDDARAARLIGRTQAITAKAGGGRAPLSSSRAGPFHERVRERLGPELFATLSEEGAAMTDEAANQLALSMKLPDDARPLPMTPPAVPGVAES